MRPDLSNEPVRVAFRVERDPLLLGVLRSAVQFQACHAGLETEPGAEFAGASEDVCRETIGKLEDPNGHLEVTMDTFHDRVEVAIRCVGQQMPAIGLETFAFAEALSGGADGLNGLELLSRVDRVLYDTEDGGAKTTLVKYLPVKD